MCHPPDWLIPGSPEARRAAECSGGHGAKYSETIPTKWVVLLELVNLVVQVSEWRINKYSNELL